MRILIVSLAAAASLAGFSPRLAAQPASIGRRVDAIRDGVVSMHFAARPGVCGDDNGSTWIPSNSSWNSRRACLTGPVFVRIGRADGSTVSIRVSVGANQRGGSPDTDLGVVAAADAAHYLMELAQGVGGRNAGDAVSAAAIADSVNIAPDLMRFVGDTRAPTGARQTALFWLGETSIATSELTKMYDGLKPYALRQHFVFVISQRRDNPAIDKLIDIASHDADHEIRKQAMYWLGQTGDPRAVKFLRDLVTR